MTTLAIIGAGIAGRSLIYALAKGQKAFSRIIVFDSDTFAPTCAFRSTAIVAPRGVSSGHSALGDLILSGLATFTQHVEQDKPLGIYPITQYTGAISKLDQFKKRYPQGEVKKSFAPFELSSDVYVATESAYMIDPDLYLHWLLDQSQDLGFEVVTSFVTQVEPTDSGVTVKTQLGEVFIFDQVVCTAGSFNRYWGEEKVGKPVQGSYFEFQHVDLGKDSFSLTLEGDNLVYHAHTKKMLIGSTTKDVSHELPAKLELAGIYERIKSRVKVCLPPIESGQIITGLREKASKRTPYIFNKGKIFWMGGFYKNGYSLSLHLAQKLAAEL